MKTPNRLFLAFALGLILTTLPAAGQTAPDLTSGFDADAESWRASDPGAVFTWKPTGGATEAYLSAQGPGGVWHFVSPAAWAGDWSEYRALKFDLGIPSRHYADDDSAGMVVIVGTNADTMTWTGPTPLWTWTHYEVKLDVSAFDVDQARFDAIMADVAELRILAEFTTSGETVGLDNVLVTAEPIEIHDQDLVERFTGAVRDPDDGTVAGWGPVDDVTLTPNVDGYPLHCLHCDDWQDGRTFKVVSPSSWAGDWSAFQEIRFDYKWTSRDNDAGEDILQVFGANGHVLSWSATVIKGEWNHFVVPLNAATFGVTQTEFDEVMGYVAKIWIRGEFDSGNDQLYLDNVVIATGPETAKVFETSLISRFGTDAEGWVVFDNASLEWLETGGISGGAIRCNDLGGGTARFCSPESWSGDWSGFGTLRFLMRSLNTNQRADYSPVVAIYGFNGGVLTVSPPVPYGTWCPYTFDLTPETFGVTQPEFDAVMSNVAHLTIVGDVILYDDSAALDDVALLAADTPAAAPPEHFSGFDTDGEAWRKGGANGANWGLVPAAPEYRTDGNPGGCIAATDDYDLTYWFSPAGWAGDWRGFESVAFDLKILYGTSLLGPGTMIAIVSVHGVLTQPVAESPALGQWNHYEFALTPAAFGVTQQEFDLVMRDAAMLAIRAEWISGDEQEALDNVRLSKAPEEYWLWLAGYLTAGELGDESIAGKSADADRDRQSNWDEFLTLTDPTDPASRFTATVLPPGPGGFTIEYATRNGRIYQVWRSETLATGSWQAVGDPVPGDDALHTHTDSSGAARAFFRVEADLP